MVLKKMKTLTRKTGKNGMKMITMLGSWRMAGTMRVSRMTGKKMKLKVQIKVALECLRVLVNHLILFTMIIQRQKIPNNRKANQRLPKKTCSSLLIRKSSSPRDMSI